MAAYVVFDIDVHDIKEYEVYRDLGAPTLAAFGGRFLVRGGEAHALEGGWTPKRIVVLEFDSAERARAWYDSQAYQEARHVREHAAHTIGILVDGYMPAAGDP